MVKRKGKDEGGIEREVVCLLRRGGVVGGVAELGERGCQAASKTSGRFSLQGGYARWGLGAYKVSRMSHAADTVKSTSTRTTTRGR
jgi:hypothetical protein